MATQYVIFDRDGRWILQDLRSARWRAKEMLKQGQATGRVDIFRLSRKRGQETMDLVAREIRLDKEPAC